MALRKDTHCNSRRIYMGSSDSINNLTPNICEYFDEYTSVLIQYKFPREEVRIQNTIEKLLDELSFA